MRYVIRPQHTLTTPAALAAALHVRSRRWPSKSLRLRPSYTRDFLFTYPEDNRLWETNLNIRETVSTLRTFFQATKFQQRMMLKAWGIPVPWTKGNLHPLTEARQSPFVVRALRHWKGQFYRVTNNPNDFRPGYEYISALFPKTREYRIIYVFGEPLIVLRKHVPEGTSVEAPWNHAVGATFKTVNDLPSCMLSQTDVFERLRNNPVIRTAHIVGVDVLWNKRGYVICEFNGAPALTIENNVLRVADYIRSVRG